MSGAGIVQDWPTHALDGLLGPVYGFSILILVYDLPKRRLLAITGPMAHAGSCHGIEAWRMLPMIIAAALHDVMIALTIGQP